MGGASFRFAETFAKQEARSVPNESGRSPIMEEALPNDIEAQIANFQVILSRLCIPNRHTVSCVASESCSSFCRIEISFQNWLLSYGLCDQQLDLVQAVTERLEAVIKRLKDVSDTADTQVGHMVLNNTSQLVYIFEPIC